MSWSYRIFKHVSDGGHTSYALHEVYLDDPGNVINRLDTPTTEHSRSIDELIEDLEFQLKCAKQFSEQVLEFVPEQKI
jgi:hypothetical protein